MNKDREFSGWGSAVFRVCALALAAAALTGCQAGRHEKIELTGGVQSIAGTAQEQKAGETDGSGIVLEEAGIVIGQDAESDGVSDQDAGAGGRADQDTETGGMSDRDTASGELSDQGAGVQQGDAVSDTLLFGGDVLLSSHVLNAYQNAGGIHGVLDEGYRDVIGNAGFFMVNEEFPFSSRGIQAADKEYTFRLDPERVSMFLEMGIDAVTLANNHALDFGQEALLDSVATLDGAGILHTGAGTNLSEARKPVETVLDGRQTAVIGATRVIPESSWAAGKNHPGMLSSYDAMALLEEIRAQKDAGKLVIVYVHWGIEKDEQPQEYQRTLGQQYIDAGADLVIGSHPHVLQGMEYYKGKPIVYSLGNFVFGSSIPRTVLLEVKAGDAGHNTEAGRDAEAGRDTEAGRDAEAGHGAEAGPGADSPLTLRLIPGTSGAGYTRMLNDDGKIREFYRYMESISFGIRIGEDGTVIPWDQENSQP